MKPITKRILSLILSLALVVSSVVIMPISASAATGITDAKGWFESAYAEWTAVSGADSYNAYVAPAGSSIWIKIDDELIRNNSGTYRVDAVGLKAGEYQIRIVPVIGEVEQTSSAMTTDTLTVLAYDRSGFAHFNYTEGVGAYNDDGTLKENAIVLYVTDETKNTVTVTSKDGTTVTGIGNILGSTGMDVGGGLNSKGGKANTNQDILRKLAADGTPLVIRIIGSVKGASSTNLSSATSEIDGLTQYDGVDYGGSVGDNGFMARMSGGKDITIEGIGPDAAIDGWGLHFICQTADYAAGYGRSFEVRNITFRNVPEDCVGMEGQQEGSTLTAPVERCWIHHCSFLAPAIGSPAESDKDGGDGACDFKRGNYFTNSYCYYESYHKTNLVGSSDSSLQYHLTYHHNYWYKCESRGPLARQADIHMYNNVFEGQTSYCMNPRANAYIFSEYNMFINCKNPVTVDSGAVKSYNDSFASCIGDNNATVVTDRSTQVSSGNLYENFDTNPAISYIPSADYEIQEDLTEMKKVVMAYAGPQPEEITSPEDINISVIPEGTNKPTAAVVLPYNQSLNSSYISANGTKDNIVFNVSKFNSDSLTVGGKATGADIIFYVDTTFNVSMTQVSGTYSPVLSNEAGVAIITGSGSAEKLPAGYYVIQSSGYDVGSSKYKEAKVASLSIEAAIVCTNHTYTHKVTAPTCTKGGYTEYTCTNCGYKYTDNQTAATGHTPGAAATCTAPQTCTVCGIELSPKTEHVYVGGVCSCGKIDPSTCSHSETTSVVTDPTCTAGGYTTYTCVACDYTYTGNNTEAKGHTPGTEATCTTAQTCTVCQAIVTAALGHNYVNYVCTRCGAEDLAAQGYAHNFTQSGKTSAFYSISGNLATNKGTVSYNGLTLTQSLKIESSTNISFNAPVEGTLTLVFVESSPNIKVDGTKVTGSNGIITVDVTAGSHTVTKADTMNLFYMEFAPAGEVHTHSYSSSVTKEATCTAEGVRTFSCECGNSYTEAIPMVDHNYVDGTCQACGLVDPATCPHAETNDVVTAPTCTAGGYTTYTCVACGYSYTGNNTEAKGHTPGAAATCTAPQLCSVCLVVLASAHGHNYVDDVCTYCGAEKPSANFRVAAGWFETAYAEWTEIDGATGYVAYVARAGSSSWTKLDNYLIRKYNGYWRVDAVGLSAGNYQIKIVPWMNGAEDQSLALTTDSLSVIAHDRSGYAFVNGTSSGAYNENGTLKDGAVVVYVTNENKDSVTATIGSTTYTGLSNILSATALKASPAPVCIRFIGNITDLEGGGTAFDKGDLLIQNNNNSIGLTLEGIGPDAVINGFGVRIKTSSNVEVRNLAFMNCDSSEGDNVGLQQDNDHIWVHNCDFFYGDAGGDADQAKGDGMLDTKKTQYVTHSYNHFWDGGKVHLNGNGDTTLNYISYHHNWYDHCDSRMPRVRVSDSIHVYNNFYDGVAKYGIGATTGCSIFSENNYYLNTARPMMISLQGTDALGDGTFSGEAGGIIKSFGDVMIITNPNVTLSFIPYSQDNTNFDAYVASSRNESVPSSVKTLSGSTSYSNFDTASGFYSYNVETAEQAMTTVKNYAGRINGGDLKWTFTDADDTDYAVNTELKSALTSYTTPIVSIGGLNGEGAGGGGQVPTCQHTNTTTKTTPATCTSTGSTVVSCTDCGATVSSTTIPATDHSYVDGKCSVCGNVDPSQCTHTNVSSNVTAPTCTAVGYTTYTCSDCGYSYTDNETPVIDHTPGAAATCTTAQTCTVCKTVITPAKGHTPGAAATCTTPETCTVCGAQTAPTTAHSYVDGICSVCGAEDLTAGDHVHIFELNGKTSDFYTFTGDNLSDTKGSAIISGTTYNTCFKMNSAATITFTASSSGKVTMIFNTGSAGKTISVNGTTYTIPSDGVLTATVAAGATTIKRVSGESFTFYIAFTSDSAHTHSYTSSVTTEATCTAAGVMTYTCSCGNSYTEEIPATNHYYLDGVCINCGISENDASGGTGDSEGGNEGGSSETLPSYIHNFTDDGWTNSFFTFAGGQITNGKHGTYTYDFGNGTETLNYALKFDSGGSVTFTPEADGKLTIAIAAEKSGRTMTLNGTVIANIDTAKSLVVVTVDVTGGTAYTLVRGSGESGLYYISYVPNPVEGGGSTDPQPPAGGTTQEPGFSGASLHVGADLSVRYHIIPEKGKTLSDYSVRFTTSKGKVIVVTDGIEENGKFVFSFCGVAPQCMGDDVKAELLDGETVIDTVEAFSVKKYAMKVFETYTADEYATLRQFLSDMLHYGVAAQYYVNYKTDTLITDGIDVLEASSYAPTSADKQRSIVTAAGADTTLVKYTAAGVRFDYNNRVYVKFTTADVANVTVTVGGAQLEIKSAGNNTYIAYSDGISALEFDDTVSFELRYNGQLIQTLNYTVNTYTYDKSGDAAIGDLALALYRYGKSAEAYEASKNS